MPENIRVLLKGRTAATSGWFWVAVVLLVLIAVFIPPLVCWCWPAANGFESCSSTIRNFGLVSAAIVALPLAVWRSWVAERQANTTQRGLLNERYQKGAEMLGSDVLTVRLGGIYALEQLASEYPEIYHIQIMQLFCAFVRHPPVRKDKPTGDGKDPDGGDGNTQPVRADIYAVMKAVGTRSQAQIDIEQKEDYRMDFSGADLNKMFLYELNLSRATLSKANMSGASLIKVNFSDAHFYGGANLSGADLSGSDLSGAALAAADLSHIKMSIETNFSDASLVAANLAHANLSGANFEGADFTGANLAGAIFYKDGVLAGGLTQRQIAFSIADPEDNPPTIDGLIDTETDEHILWSERPTVV